MVKWHDGTTCAEFKEMQNKDKPEEQILSEEYAKQNLQECPNCNVSILSSSSSHSLPLFL